MGLKLQVPALWGICCVHVLMHPPCPFPQHSPWGLLAVGVLYNAWGPCGSGDPCYTRQKKERGGSGEARGSAWFPGCPNREQRDPIYLKDKVTQRHSKEQFETAQKIEQEYSRYFTGRCAYSPERRSRQQRWKQASQRCPPWKW